MEKDQLEIILEDIRGKFDLVLEGHEALRQEIRDARTESNEKHDLTTFQIKALAKKVDDETGKLNKKIDDETGKLDQKLSRKIESETDKLHKKIDAIIVDLAEHRADTERHRTDYKVSE